MPSSISKDSFGSSSTITKEDQQQQQQLSNPEWEHNKGMFYLDSEIDLRMQLQLEGLDEGDEDRLAARRKSSLATQEMTARNTLMNKNMVMTREGELVRKHLSEEVTTTPMAPPSVCLQPPTPQPYATGMSFGPSLVPQ